MELKNMIKILRRWSWLIISIVGVTVLALFLGLKLAKPVYEAQVKLQISTPQQEDVAVYDEYRSVNLRDMITVARNNFVAILESDEIHNRTLQALNIDPEQNDFKLETDSSSDSDFITVIVKAPSSQLAASVANTLVDQAIGYYGEMRAQPTVKERDLYAEQLDAAEETYRAAADAFTAFKAKNNIGVLQEEIATTQRLLEQLQSDRDQQVLGNVKDPISQVKELMTQRQMELDRLNALEPEYLILEGNYQDAREEYRQTLTQIVPGYQRVSAEEKYHNAEQAFNEFKNQNNITSLQNEIALNNELLKQLQLELDQRLLEDSDKEGLLTRVDGLILERKQELDRLSALQPTYSVLEEKANEAQARYQHISSKFTEADVKATVVRAANFIQIVEPAYEPPTAINNSIKFLVLGIIGSLGFGIVLAFLLEYLTETGEEALLVDKVESHSLMGLPVLGRIPVMENPLYKTDTREAEIIRQLRANILLSPASHSLKTILIASPQPEDGKTITTANLGIAMANGKSKVVIVDADLRNPYLHKVFELPNLGGLSDLLSADKNNLEQLLPQYMHDTDIPGLSLLSAGKLPQDPSLLLSSQNLKIIFEELSRKFDFILVDSSPFYAAPDSTILSKYVDGILLVVCPGRSSLRAAEETIHSFSSNGSNILGFVLNRTSRDHYSYQYYTRQESKQSVLERMLSFISTFEMSLDPDLISLDQAAKILGVRRKTVVRWCQEDQLTAKRINLRYWVKREELRDFVLNRFGVEIPLDNFKNPSTFYSIMK